MTKDLILVTVLVLLYLAVQLQLWMIRERCLNQAKREGQQMMAELTNLDRPIKFDKLTVGIAETIDAHWQNRQYFLRQAAYIWIISLAYTIINMLIIIILLI